SHLAPTIEPRVEPLRLLPVDRADLAPVGPGVEQPGHRVRQQLDEAIEPGPVVGALVADKAQGVAISLWTIAPWRCRREERVVGQHLANADHVVMAIAPGELS